MKADSTEPQLTGYSVKGLLTRSRSNGRASYRVYRQHDNAAFTAEILDTDYPERKHVALMQRDGMISRQLADIVGVRKVHDIITHGSGNIALIVDSYDDSLASFLQKKEQGMTSLDVVEIALQLIDTLNQVHSRDIIHKAVSPQNIYYDAKLGLVALAGFGLASELKQERQAAPHGRQIDGPLAYISPEQTGRMNRDIDYRSDYYSLGVLLYELLTGQLPIQADNLLSWVHKHLSFIPVEPHAIRSDIPETLSAIILKLLAKNPDERYQSAQGIIYDLQSCADRLIQGLEIIPFELATKDKNNTFLLSQKLYGRDAEIETLLALFESAVAGGNELCMVHGYSGVGKSSLVNEIDRPIVRERGFLVQGKFQQFQTNAAYSTIAGTFRALVHQVLSLSENELASWRQNLLTALAPNAQLVIELVPELAVIIGDQPPVAELPATEARNRLHIVLTSFLNVFATKAHPVVLFLDDLQWCNVPTLDLLRHFVTAHELSHLLIIGAYRNNEVSHGHPLQLFLNNVEARKSIHQLALQALTQNSVTELVTDVLHNNSDETKELAQIVFEKSQGNPFFINELLRYLHEKGALSFNLESGSWSWDRSVTDWSGVSNDVVEFMVENLRKMPKETQLVLQLAACIGSSFDLNTLSIIYKRSVNETAEALLIALKQHSVFPLDDDYRLVNESIDSKDFNPCYRFQHDRVQQAAYALIEQQNLAEVHLSIGRMMLKELESELTPEQLIDIVNHLNKGRYLIVLEQEKAYLSALNLQAATQSRQASSYEQAWEYLAIAQQCLPTNPWQSKPEFMQQLAQETQQCAYLTGRTKEAELWINHLLEHAGSALERSDILATQTRQYATLGRMEDSIQSAIQGLALLGINFTDSPTDADIALERKHVISNLAGRSIADLVNAKQLEDPATLIAMRLLMEIFAAAFLIGSGKLFPYLVLKSVNLSLQYGNAPESAFAYAAYGMVLCGEFDEPELGYEYGQVGLAINERLDDLTLRARVIYVYAMFIHHWSQHWQTLTPWFNKGIEAGYQSGDLLYLAYSAQDCVIWDPTLDLETAHKLHAENLQIVRDCDYQDSLDSGTLFLQFQRNLLGLTDDPFSLSDSEFDEQQCLQGMRDRQFMTGISNYQIYSAEISFLYGDYDKALSYVYAEDVLIKSAMSLPQLVRFYVVSFLTLTTHYSQMDAINQQQTRERLEGDLTRMTRWADNCAENFRHIQYLMQAELAALDGLYQPALDYFDQSIEHAKQSGFLHDEATACEQAAKYLLSLDKDKAAEGYLRAAYRLYARWGAQRKVTLMEQMFPVLLELKLSRTTSQQYLESSDIDLASVMKASRLISGEIIINKLLTTTMQLLLENAGGQWGCLVVKSDEGLHVEAHQPASQIMPKVDLANHSHIKTANGDMIALPLSIINEVLQTNKAVVLHDASNDGPFIHVPYISRYQPKSILCVPIKRERFEGVIYMENNLSSHVFTEQRVEIIHLLAAQAAVAIENAKLYEQMQEHSRTLEERVSDRTEQLEQLNQELQDLADCDGLTGVANRRKGDLYLNEVWSRLRRYQKPLSVIMLDVDSFKAFNDNYGHQAGDDCLIAVAHAVRDQLQRPTDLLARYGGEEFLVILPETDKSGVLEVAEKIRHAVESKAIEHDFSLAENVVTISSGVATVVPSMEQGIDNLLLEADKALYQAKHDGRNRVSSIQK